MLAWESRCASFPKRARYFMKRLNKAKKSGGELLSVNELHDTSPTKVKNYGIWLRYDSRTNTHNMYKDLRQTLQFKWFQLVCSCIVRLFVEARPSVCFRGVPEREHQWCCGAALPGCLHKLNSTRLLLQNQGSFLDVLRNRAPLLRVNIMVS